MLAQDCSDEQDKKSWQEYTIQHKWWFIGMILLGVVGLSWLTHRCGTHKCLNGGIGCLTFIVVVIGVICAIQQLHALKQVHIDNHEWNRRLATQEILNKYEALSDKKTALNKKLKDLDKVHSINLDVINDLFKDDYEAKVMCCDILNYYEELAIGISWGVYEEEMVKQSLKTNLLRIYNVFSKYIEHIQAEQPTAYENFGMLVDKWNPKKPAQQTNKLATGKK